MPELRAPGTRGGAGTHPSLDEAVRAAKCRKTPADDVNQRLTPAVGALAVQHDLVLGDVEGDAGREAVDGDGRCAGFVEWFIRHPAEA